jgi:hypothetical protein
MAKAPESFTVDDHFAGNDPALRDIYDRLLAALRRLGPFREEAKKTSIHLARSSALAGVQVRKGYLLLTIKANREFDSPRVHKIEQVSANRFHHEVKLSSPGEVDRELQGWLKEAHELSA